MEYLPIKTLYLELTHACNQHCRHCYLDGGSHHKVAEMSTAQIIGILEEFKAQGGKYLVLTGGEPFMRKDIFSILDCAERLGLPFNLASNSLAMNEERRTRLAGYRCLDMYFTSILGKDALLHRAVAGKDSYQKAMDTVAFFDEKGVNTYVQVTLARSYVNQIREIAAQLLPYEHCTIKFTPIGNLGVKEETVREQERELVVPESAFAAFHGVVEELQKQYPNRIENCNIMNHEQIREMIAEYDDEELYALCYGFLAIRPDGAMSFSTNMGNPYTFGWAYEGLQITVESLKQYIRVLRKAEQLTLREAESKIVELDVTVDKYIKMIHEGKIAL